MEEKLIKRTLIRRKEADAKRRKLWALIVRKEIPRVCQSIWLMVFCWVCSISVYYYVSLGS